LSFTLQCINFLCLHRSSCWPHRLYYLNLDCVSTLFFIFFIFILFILIITTLLVILY